MAIYHEKTVREVEAFQWFTHGDHPKVRRRHTDPKGIQGIILTKDGPKIVNPNDFVVKVASNDYKIFPETEFYKKYH